MIQFPPPPGAGVDLFGTGLNTNGAGASTTLAPISLILNHFLKSPPAFRRRRFQHLSDTQSLKCHPISIAEPHLHHPAQPRATPSSSCATQSHTFIILRHPTSSHCAFLIQFLPPSGAGVNLFGAGPLTFGAGAFLRGVPAPQNAILRSTVAQAPAI